MIKRNTQIYQGYGVGNERINEYQNTSNSPVYGFSKFRPQQPQMGPNFPYPMPMVIPPSPSISKIEQENSNNGYGPTYQRPTFRVPTPGEQPNAESGYAFSGGVFQPHTSIDSQYSSKGGGYGYGYGYGYVGK